jgi:hypothetical protein
MNGWTSVNIKMDPVAAQAAERPTQHDQIRDAIWSLARGPNWQDEIEANGTPVASQPTEGNGSSGPPDSTR